MKYGVKQGGIVAASMGLRLNACARRQRPASGIWAAALAGVVSAVCLATAPVIAGEAAGNDEVVVMPIVPGLLASSGSPVATNPEPTSIEAFTEPGGITSARLSPDGKHIAVITFDGHDSIVRISPTDKLNFFMLAGTSYDRDGFYIMHYKPRSVVWLSNTMVGVNYDVGARAFTVAGKSKAKLGERIIGPIAGGDPEHAQVLVYTDVEDGTVAIMDAVNGEKIRYKFPSAGKPVQMAFDRQGVPRAVTMSESAFWGDKTTITNWYRPSATASWQKLAEFRLTDEYWVPLYVPDEPDTLQIASRGGRDTYAVFSYDTRTRTVGKMLAGYDGQDVLLAKGQEKQGFQHIRTGGMIPQQAWFDPVWAKIQADIDVTLPGRVNIISGKPDEIILVFSYSASNPGSWHLYDMRKVTMGLLGSTREAIKPEAMQSMQAVRYPAADGLEIPAYLTLPVGSGKNLPTVVMIHGGPTYRDHWGWDQDVQFLASRGYAVLQPQFRGSTGFGRKFEQAGYGQWGLAMQDDVTAGVAYLVSQGIADPSRICIVGGSYGGYAALWGLVKTPELYKCGVSFAGVTDLELMFKDSSDTSKNKVARELMRSRIGDPEQNRQQFDEVSPLKSAQRIQAPVLLMHGTEDQRVPIVHAERMLKALKQHGKQVEWETFEKEGHGLYYTASQMRYLKTLGAFLDKHLGQPKPPAQATQSTEPTPPAKSAP